MCMDRGFHFAANRYGHDVFLLDLYYRLREETTAIGATAASIFVTLSGPPQFCDANTPLSVCASITILVPISWIAATLRESLFYPLTPVGVLTRSAPSKPSARLLCCNSGVMRRPFAHAPEDLVHVDIRHRMVRRRGRETFLGSAITSA